MSNSNDASVVNVYTVCTFPCIHDAMRVPRSSHGHGDARRRRSVPRRKTAKQVFQSNGEISEPLYLLSPIRARGFTRAAIYRELANYASPISRREARDPIALPGRILFPRYCAGSSSRIRRSRFRSIFFFPLVKTAPILPEANRAPRSWIYSADRTRVRTPVYPTGKQENRARFA